MMKLKQVWITTQIVGIMLTMFFTLFIPSVAGVFWFSIQIAMTGQIWAALILFITMVFGALFISMAIVYRITFYYNEFFKWDKEYENLKER